MRPASAGLTTTVKPTKSKDAVSTAKSESKSMIWGLSARDWLWWSNEVRIWAAVVAVILGVVAAGAQWAQIRLTSIVSAEKDEEFRRYRVDAEERIALAERAGAEATATAALANSEAERLHQRAAELEVEAAKARLDQEQTKARLSWRDLPQGERERLVATLRNTPGPVTIAWIANDPETLSYAQMLGGAFRDAGWEVHGEARFYPTLLLRGLYVPGLRTAAISTIRRAFRASGINASSNDVPAPTMHVSDGATAEGAPLVMVGTKQLPW